MLKSDNRISLCLGIPGIILHFSFVPVILYRVKYPHNAIPIEYNFFSILSIIGTVLLFFGLAYYAKAKGHSMAWGFMGFLGIIGLIVLACLSDRTVRVASLAQVQNDTGMDSQRAVAATVTVIPATSGFAVASLVLGIIGICCVPLSIVGLILAILALDTYPPMVKGRGIAIAGLVLSNIGIIWFSLLLWSIILSPSPIGNT